jgi:hypothetical protein
MSQIHLGSYSFEEVPANLYMWLLPTTLNTLGLKSILCIGIFHNNYKR